MRRPAVPPVSREGWLAPGFEGEQRIRQSDGLEICLIEPDRSVGSQLGRVLCRKRLGGLLKYYYRAAA